MRETEARTTGKLRSDFPKLYLVSSTVYIYGLHLLSPELYFYDIRNSHPLLCPSWGDITWILFKICVCHSYHMDMWPCCSDYILREKHVALYIDWFKITSTSSVADYESKKKTNCQFISETHIYPTMTALGICTKTCY